MQKQIVYVLFRNIDYEGSDVLGIYWDKEYAESLAIAWRLRDKWNEYSVEPWTVD